MKNATESRLNRWSRVKTKSKRKNITVEPQSLALETSDVVLEQASDENLPVVDTAEIVPEIEDDDLDLDVLAETHDLPSIETLVKESDYTPFLQTGVPEALKRAAMRKLWLSDPVLANVDGLNDYDEDYNIIDRLISALDTNYQVGKGMIDPNDEIEEQPDDKNIENIDTLNDNDPSTQEPEDVPPSDEDGAEDADNEQEKASVDVDDDAIEMPKLK